MNKIIVFVVAAAITSWAGSAKADQESSKAVNDTSHFFSADAKVKGEAQIELTSRRTGLQVSIETFDSLPVGKDLSAFATARGKDAPIKGVRLIIVRKGGHVSVRADPGTSKVFDGNVQQELAKRVNACLRKGTQHFDEALLDAVAFIDGQLVDLRIPKAAAKGLLGNWVASKGGASLIVEIDANGVITFSVVTGLRGTITRRGNGAWVMSTGFGGYDQVSFDSSKRTLAFGNGPAFERAAPRFVQALKSEEKEDREKAEQDLGRLQDLSGDADVILPELLSMAKDADPDLRERGLRVLGKASCNAPTAEAISAIQQGFKDKEVTVIASAAFAAGIMGKEAGPVLPQLIETLKLPNSFVRIHVANALCGDVATLPGTEAAVPLLITILTDTKPDNAENKRLRERVIGALGRIGPRAKDSVPALVGLFKDQDKAVRQAAADSLGCIGPAAAAALPALTEMAKADLSQDARKRAEAAIKSIQANRPQ